MIFLVLVVIYLSIAFEWRMAVAALVALIHDLTITVGVYALVGFEVTPATVIGLLTILGYSLYDTVVVFDKVRENTAGHHRADPHDLQPRSPTSRSTRPWSGRSTPRSSRCCRSPRMLFIGGGLLGAGTLKDLSLALFVGLAAGAYSSIFIATPLLADLKEREPAMKALAKRVAQPARGRPSRRRRPRAGRRPSRRPRRAADGRRRAGARDGCRRRRGGRLRPAPQPGRPATADGRPGRWQPSAASRARRKKR